MASQAKLPIIGLAADFGAKKPAPQAEDVGQMQAPGGEPVLAACFDDQTFPQQVVESRHDKKIIVQRVR
jgi:hypothetical protein